MKIHGPNHTHVREKTLPMFCKNTKRNVSSSPDNNLVGSINSAEESTVFCRHHEGVGDGERF